MTKDELINKLLQENARLRSELEKSHKAIEHLESEAYESYIYNYEYKEGGEQKEERVRHSLRTPFKEHCDSTEVFNLLDDYIESDKEYCLKSFCGKRLNKETALPNDSWEFWLNLSSDRPRYKWNKEMYQWKLYAILKVLKPNLNASIETIAEVFFGIPNIRTTLNRNNQDDYPSAKNQINKFMKGFHQKASRTKSLKLDEIDNLLFKK